MSQKIITVKTTVVVICLAVVAQLLLLATTSARAEGLPSTYTPRSILVTKDNHYVSTLSAQPSYNYGQKIDYFAAEENLQTISGKSSPFVDACWYGKTLPDTIIEHADIAEAGPCLLIEQLDIDSEKITVTPKAEIAMTGNDDVELSLPYASLKLTPAQAISQHVIFMYASPDEASRFTYIVPTAAERDLGSDPHMTAGGVGVFPVPNAHGTYTQVVYRESSQEEFNGVVTLSCDRWCRPDPRGTTTRNAPGTMVFNTGSDISTPERTIQQFTFTSTHTQTFRIVVNDLRLATRTIHGGYDNPETDFGNDTGTLNYGGGGNPAYVRKIFVGDGYGPTNGSSSSTMFVASENGEIQSNADSCTINGSVTEEDPDCRGDYWGSVESAGSHEGMPDEAHNGWMTAWSSNRKHIDNGTWNRCKWCWGATDFYDRREAHLNSGAAGGCTKDSQKSYLTASELEQCLKPRNAPTFTYMGWQPATAPKAPEYKIWFDHVETGNRYVDIHQNFLSEIVLNGEHIPVKQLFTCNPDIPGSVAGQSTAPDGLGMKDCTNILKAWWDIGETNKDDYYAYNDIDDYVDKDKTIPGFLNWTDSRSYPQLRKKLLNIQDNENSSVTARSANAPLLLDKLITTGPNAGTRIKVRLINARIAGEFKSMIDDMSIDVDYTGHCIASKDNANICGWQGGLYRPSKGLMWSTRYEVSIQSPQHIDTSIKAFYGSTANSRFRAGDATGIEAPNTTHDTTYSSLDIQSDNSLKEGGKDRNPNTWTTLCTTGTDTPDCSWVFSRQLYTPTESDPTDATIRFQLKNGYIPSDGFTVSTRNGLSSTNRPMTTTTTSDPTSLHYTQPLATNDVWNISLKDTFGVNDNTYGTPIRSVRMRPVNYISVGPVEEKPFSVDFLQDDATTPVANMQSIGNLTATTNNTFVIPRPSGSTGQHRFAAWKMVWCTSAAYGSCTAQEPAYHRNPDGTRGEPITNLLPGTLFTINSIYNLTDPTADPTYNNTHHHLALMPIDSTGTADTPTIYGFARKLTDRNTLGNHRIHDVMAYFTGVPGLTATARDTQWNNPYNREEITHNNLTYHFKENLSQRSAVLPGEADGYPLYMLFAPLALTFTHTLTTTDATPTPPSATLTLTETTTTTPLAWDSWLTDYTDTTGTTHPFHPGHTLSLTATPTLPDGCALTTLTLDGTPMAANTATLTLPATDTEYTLNGTLSCHQPTPPTLTLPLTGGKPADLYLIAGTLLTIAAATAAGIHLRTRPRNP